MALLTCSICGQAKVTAEFHRNKTKKTGFNSQCRVCKALQDRAYRLKNIEILRAKNRARASKNSEANRARSRCWEDKNRAYHQAKKRERYHADLENNRARTRAYRAANIAQERARAEQWVRDNPARVRANNARHRAENLRATPSWLTAIQQAQIQEFYDIAEARSTQTGVLHHVDHVHPLRGVNFRGLHVPWNLEVLTRDDNMKKSNRLLDASLAMEF